MSLITVKATLSHSVPREGCPGHLIGQEPVVVESSHYYRAFLSEGSLEEVPPPVPEVAIPEPITNIDGAADSAPDHEEEHA